VPKNGACSLFRTQSEGKEVKQIPEGKSKYDGSTPWLALTEFVMKLHIVASLDPELGRFLFQFGSIPGGQRTPVGHPLASDVKIRPGKGKVVPNQSLSQLHMVLAPF